LKLPDFPWDALAPYGDRARTYKSGIIDLSQGTPVDATPDFIQEELKANSNSPSYPVTAGTVELRFAITKYAKEVIGASGEFDVLPTIGSKEMVALLPFLLGAKRILIPKIAYPTYRVGGIIAGAEILEVDIDPATWPTEIGSGKVDLVWINSPSNPTGRVHTESELDAILSWSRALQIPIASDECYLPFPDTNSALSILKIAAGDNRGLLALHSLSKRSNLAGYRAAFVLGDQLLIKKLLEIRKHLGLMMPLPIQRAMEVALQDEQHVQEQAARYRQRRTILSSALQEIGFNTEHSNAGLYIWCTRGEEDWQTVSWFAERGILVTPGNFYGSAGSKFVRIALTATDEKIKEAAERIRKS
jgi:succinyldiaminopimelate transaminase